MCFEFILMSGISEGKKKPGSVGELKAHDNDDDDDDDDDNLFLWNG